MNHPFCRSAIILVLGAACLLVPLSPSSALIRPTADTNRAGLWRSIYDHLPAAFKSDAVVLVREVSDREMARLVEENEDVASRDSEEDDRVQGFFEYAGPRHDRPTIVLRESLTDSEAGFVFTHEYAHFIWEDMLSRREQDDYFAIWNARRRARRLVSPYASESVIEGFAEAFAHFVDKPSILRRRDGESARFLRDWIDSRESRKRSEL